MTEHYIHPEAVDDLAALERDRAVGIAIRSLLSLNGVETPWRAPVPGWYRTMRLAEIRGRLMASVKRQARMLGVEL